MIHAIAYGLLACAVLLPVLFLITAIALAAAREWLGAVLMVLGTPLAALPLAILLMGA